jgi:predicted metal-dependent hydrolase
MLTSSHSHNKIACDQGTAWPILHTFAKWDNLRSMPHTDRYMLFVEYFNNGKFMSAQTTLDEDWIDEEGERKAFLGGLIQVAVSLYQATNDNAQGAAKIYQKAKNMLLPYGEKKEGIDLKKLLADCDAFYANVETEKLTDLEYMKKAPKIDFQS